MRQFTDILRIPTRGRGLLEITRDVLDWLRPHQVRTGLLTLFCRHTSAGLLLQEMRRGMFAPISRVPLITSTRRRRGDIGMQTKAPTTCRPTSEPR